MRTLAQTDKFVLARHEAGTTALAHMVMLAQLVPNYAAGTFFDVIEQLLAHVHTDTYAILYERSDKDGALLVPVAFSAWAKLSRSRAALWRNGIVALNTADMNSGPHMWLTMAAKELGHGKELKDLLFRALENEPVFFARSAAIGQFITEKNPYHKGG